MDTCISKFKSAVLSIIEWCDYNRLDINWSKTYAMFVHNKTDLKINIDKITINSKIQVAIVDKFKLLGVTIDNQLKFTTNVAETAIKVNKKIHCIKRLFYLSTNVKLQFFKTFLLPYFDYCLTLTIYYSKTALQKLSNLYYNCLYKLFKFQLNNMEFKWINDFLKKYNLFSFQHRVFYRLSIFSFNCKNNKTIDIIETNLVRNTGHNLRNTNHLTRYHVNLKEGKKTFHYFFSKFINSYYVNKFHLKFSLFKRFVFDNFDLFFDHFICIFPNFHLQVNIFYFKKI